MKILLVHNRYQLPGGEGRAFEADASLLESNGHAVVRHTADNRAIDEMSRVGVAASTIWNRTSARRIRELVREERPDIVHFHNTFPLISPAAYYAVAREGVPVVQTLHNFRLLCANALFYRDGGTCVDCLSRPIGWPGVLHRCYRSSRAASAVVVGMQATHRALGTWSRSVDVYIALSRFASGKFIEGGLPPERIVVRPNHVAPDPGPGSGSAGQALFVGRLSPEKGVGTLLGAWRQLEGELPLVIVGDGPLAAEVRAAADSVPNVRWLGQQPHDVVLRLLGDARCLIFPSQCFENCPMVILEALARGTPVVASTGGSASELVEEGVTGSLFDPGSEEGLIEAVRRLVSALGGSNQMREAARRAFLVSYTASAAYEGLCTIYERAGAAAAVPVA